MGGNDVKRMTWWFLAAMLVAVSARANLLENGSFESPVRTNDWSNTWGSFAVEAWNSPPDGVYAAYLKGSWATLGDFGGTVQKIDRITPGTGYELKAKIYADNGWSADTKRMKLEFFDEQHVLLYAVTNDLALVTENRWTEYTLSATAPPRSTHAQIVFEASGIGGPGVLGFDDVRLNEVQSKPMAAPAAPSTPLPAALTNDEPTEYLTEPSAPAEPAH